LRDLLAGNGTPAVADGADCDKRSWGNNDGVDNFEEVLERIDGAPLAGPPPYPNTAYQLRDCVSPRVVNVVVIDSFASNPAHIVAFASFYIMGCFRTPAPPPASMTPNRCPNNGGQTELWGIFFNRVELGGDIGEFNPYGNNAIALVE
jgi:hypothetical protein